MKQITKKERDYLESNGCVFPEDLHHNFCHHKKSWYATENKKVLSLINKYYKDHIVSK